MTTDPFTSVQTTTGREVEPANVERDQYGRYKIPPLPEDFREQFKAKGYADPGPGVKAWTRATTLAKTISDTFGLSQWSQRMVAKGIAARPDLYAGAAACQLSDKKTLDSIVDQAKDAAASRAGANLGTAYHSFTEAIDRGEDPVIPVEEWRRDLNSYRDLLTKHNVRMLTDYIERTVVNNRWNVAGTLDRIGTIGDDPKPKIGDVKSGKSMEYDSTHLEIAIQLLLYATADAIWDWGRRVFLPLPEGIDQLEAFVIHLPVGKGKADLYRVNIGAAVAGADLCVAVRAWRKTKGTFALITEEQGPDTLEPLLGDLPEEPPRSVSDVMTDMAEGFNTGVAKMAETITKTLAPLAGPGQRGCSVCRRTGHRKGSPVCLGANDPAHAAAVETLDLRNGTGAPPIPAPLTAEWCLRTGPCVAAGWTAPISADSDPDNMPWRCANCGKPSRSGIVSGTGQPVTGTIGTERRPENKGEAAFAEIEAEDVAANGPADLFTSSDGAEQVKLKQEIGGDPVAPADLFTSVKGEGTEGATSVPAIADHDAGVTDEDGGDPFADETPAEPTWEDKVRAAKSKADMRAIREAATAAGEWSAELTKLGIKVLSELERK